MEHIRLQALKKLCELLERETGYKVYRGRQVIGTSAKDEGTFLVINEAIRSGRYDPPPSGASMLRKDTVDFLLSGYMKTEDTFNPIDSAYEAVAKIEQAFGRVFGRNPQNGDRLDGEYYLLGGLITNFKYLSPICHNPPDAVKSDSYFYIQFSFDVAYTAFDPYQAHN